MNWWKEHGVIVTLTKYLWSVKDGFSQRSKQEMKDNSEEVGEEG